MTEETLTQSILNAERSLALAKVLFPQEEWVATEHNIWVARSRLSQKEKEPKKWEKEMSQARILTSRGSVAYFLPEVEIKGEIGKRSADLVLDGEVVEMKTITGKRATLGKKFKLGYKQGKSLLATNLPDGYPAQGHSVFILLVSDIKIEAVKTKIAGELKNRLDQGRFICFFKRTNELYSWSYQELREIIGK